MQRNRQNDRQHLSRRSKARYLRNVEHYDERRDRVQESSDWDQVMAVASDVIEKKLPKNLKQILGFSVESKILSVHEGSIILFFGIALTGYNIISNYKNFYESANLIRKQCELLLSEILKTKFGEDFEIRVTNEVPYFETSWLRDRYWYEDPNWFVKLRYQILKSLTFSQVHGQRDGLFYYLLSLNIVLLMLVAILVYKAVTKTYFM